MAAVSSATSLYEAKQKQESPLAKLFGTMKRFKIQIIIGIIFEFVGICCRLASPLLVKEISTMIVNNDFNFARIGMFGGIAVGLYVIGGFLEYINIYMMVGVTAATSKQLRKDMSEKINRMPLNYFDTRNIGDVLSYLTNDVDVIGTTLTSVLTSLFSAAFTMIGILVILYILSWQLGLVATIAIPVALIVLVLIGSKTEKQYVKRQNYLSSVSSEAEEAYTAYNIVRVFRANKRFKQEFAEANHELEKASNKADFYGSLMTPVMNFIGYLMVVAICLIGSWLASRVLGTPEAAAAITTIVTAVTYANQLISPLSQLAQIFASLSQTMAAANRVFDFLEAEEEPDESDKTGKIEKIEGNISFEHVRFGYNKDRVIIHDFSEKAKKGQKVAIVGPTGAGKTTMVNLLMRFYEINQGKIAIEGVDTKTLNRSYVRSLFGMVLQDTWLFEGTYMENLKYSRRDATDEEVIEACKATHCDTFIRQQPGGYNGMITEECGLSSGQKQLLTIARAMVQNAPMLILDEATSSVDTRTELLIQDAMDKLMKGRTSFVIAHRLSTIKNSDLILVMKDGDVIESGNHDELMKKKGFYSELYNAQFSGKGPQID